MFVFRKVMSNDINGNISDVVGKRGRMLDIVIFIFIINLEVIEKVRLSGTYSVSV